jgi:hypothetical protein
MVSREVELAILLGRLAMAQAHFATYQEIYGPGIGHSMSLE